MTDPLKIMTWHWVQNPPRADFSAETVNRWAAQVRRHVTIPHALACVTDHPEGIDEDIEILPLSEIVPPKLLLMQAPGWSEKAGLPQCWRRLLLFHENAEAIFGAEWLVSMDQDCAIFANIDDLFARDHDFRMFAGTSGKRPYNGSMIMIRAGARPHVYTEITPEAIAESRRKFIGSDQAWISHVLGWKERTWGPKEGVYAWSPRFVQQNSSRGGFMLPGDTKMIFFPAHPKPWDLRRTHPQVYAVWEGSQEDPRDAFRPPPVRKNPNHLRIWAYDDPKGWGKAFQAEVKKLGHRGWLFTNAQGVADDEPAFVRLDQQGQQRDVSKNLLARLAERQILTLPTAQEGLWYDDKVAQHAALKDWMPETWIETSREAAEERLEYLTMQRAFPIISKAAEGAGSGNVKVLHNEDEAWAEIVTVFGSGVPLKYGRIQRDYVYWQRLVAENPCDYRAVIVGNYVYGLVRRNRPGTYFASGSGSNYPIQLVNERERAACSLAVEIAGKLQSQWMAFDVVFEGEGADRPRVLELSSAWTMKAYSQCPLFTRQLEATTLTGERSFHLAAQILIEAFQTRLREAA